MRYTILVVLCLLIRGESISSPARAQDRPKPLLPADAKWKHRWDGRLDGELKDTQELVIEISVRNNRITGKFGDQDRWTGEIVPGPGNFPIVTLRQDHTDYVAVYSGKLVKEGHIVGVHYNTLGGSGDFELVLEKE